MANNRSLLSLLFYPPPITIKMAIKLIKLGIGVKVALNDWGAGGGENKSQRGIKLISSSPIAGPVAFPSRWTKSQEGNRASV